MKAALREFAEAAGGMLIGMALGAVVTALAIGLGAWIARVLP